MEAMKVLAGAAIVQLGVALDAPCYGYGQILGSPSKYLEDDMDNAVKFNVAQQDTYLAYLDFLFEGKNYIQAMY